MVKIKFAALAVVVVMGVSSVAFAGSPSISYTAKKQGRVSFESADKMKDDAQEISNVDAINPADIEPAAGGYEPVDSVSEDDFSKSMRLPRKN